MINRLIHCTTVLHNAYINKNRKHRYQKKLSNSISFLFHTVIYTNLHLTDDSMVPVLRNTAFKFSFYMYLKEGLYTWKF